MSVMIFYEKPGCLTNRKQKALLDSAGVKLEVRDLLSHPWVAQELESFLQSRPVSEWFNPAAPRVKSGELVTASLQAGEALKLLLAEPLLIRRPLLEWNGHRVAGFDIDRLREQWGLPLTSGSPESLAKLDQCSRTESVGVCP